MRSNNQEPWKSLRLEYFALNASRALAAEALSEKVLTTTRYIAASALNTTREL